MSFIESDLIRKELEPFDMHMMGVGRRYWHVELAKIDPSFDYRETISKYIEKVREHVLAGRGLLFHGEYAGGKTSAAVIVAKAVVMHGGTVYFIEVPELSDVKIGTRPFDENTTIWERMMKVDVLILDDIGSEYGTPWSKQLVERAIRLRANAKKPIIGTTNRFGELRTIYGEGVVSVMTSSMLPVLIEGKNWREDEEEQLKKAILGE
jgi:DNA replication protein DnaC